RQPRPRELDAPGPVLGRRDGRRGVLAGQQWGRGRGRRGPSRAVRPARTRATGSRTPGSAAKAEPIVTRTDPGVREASARRLLGYVRVGGPVRSDAGIAHAAGSAADGG